ncbi:hypothetical protein PybrP1_009578 [[Pythium] brassicae (nom. inval.)]|nr:hypothetical protein PybrP1_009578 [[Pythium] brassicae (nom. inval.)]
MTQISYQFALTPARDDTVAKQHERSSHRVSGARKLARVRGGGGSGAAAPTSASHATLNARKPLERSKLSVAGKSMHASRYPPRVLSAADNTEFYTNIWTAPPTTAERDEPGVRKFVDISQVAYVVTTIDFKQGYDTPRTLELVNIWTLEPYSVASSAAVSRDSISVEASHSPRHLSNLTNISEEAPDDDDGDGDGDGPQSSARTAQYQIAYNYSLSGSLATPPSQLSYATDTAMTYASAGAVTTTFRGPLRKGISEEELERVASTPVSGPQQRGERAVFSPVLAQNNEVDRTWHARFLLSLHEPVRHALFVIDRFLARLQCRRSPADASVGEFFAWFKTHFVEFVKNQHDVKTKVVLPLLRVDYVVKRDVQHGYDMVYEVLDAICTQEDEVVFSAASASVAWQDKLAVLQSAIRRLNLLVNSVLTAEERVLSPVLGRTFSSANFQRYVMPRIFRASKPKRVVIPWIVERYRIWGGDAAAQAYRDELPFTARFLYERMWLPYFVSHVAQAMKHLDTEMTGMMAADSTAADAGWFGCSIQ